jgi:arsenite oxidase large subunit
LIRKRYDCIFRRDNTILGVKAGDFQFSSLMKNGHIELTKAAVTAVAIVTPAIKKGMMYANMLDMRQPSNALQPAVVDWISGNYNYKMGVARVKKLSESKYKNEFRSLSFPPRNIV